MEDAFFFFAAGRQRSPRAAAAHRAAACGAVRSERYAAYRAVQRRGTAAFRSAPDGGAGSVLERQHTEYTAPVHKYTVCLHRRGGHRRNGLHGRNDPAPRRALLAYLRRDRAALRRQPAGHSGQKLALSGCSDGRGRAGGVILHWQTDCGGSGLAVPAADALGFTDDPLLTEQLSAALRPVSALPRRCAARRSLRAVQNSSYRCRSMQTRSLTRDWCVPQSITC